VSRNCKLRCEIFGDAGVVAVVPRVVFAAAESPWRFDALAAPHEKNAELAQMVERLICNHTKRHY
jgi:hypothetical protein